MDKAAETLLSDFGRAVGIDELAFDENRCVRLTFDEQEIVIEHVEDQAEFLLHANIGELPPVADAGLYEKLLMANHTAAAGGLGTIGINRATRQIVYLDRVTLRALTQQQFQDTLAKVVDRVEFWCKALKGPYFEAASTNGSGRLDGDGDLSSMIRI